MHLKERRSKCLPGTNSQETFFALTYLEQYLRRSEQLRSCLVGIQDPKANTPLLNKPLFASLLQESVHLDEGQAILILHACYFVDEEQPTPRATTKSLNHISKISHCSLSSKLVNLVQVPISKQRASRPDLHRPILQHMLPRKNENMFSAELVLKITTSGRWKNNHIDKIWPLMHEREAGCIPIWQDFHLLYQIHWKLEFDQSPTQEEPLQNWKHLILMNLYQQLHILVQSNQRFPVFFQEKRSNWGNHRCLNILPYQDQLPAI